MQALPEFTSTLPTVLMLTSHTREIERMDEPSQSSWRIWTRLDMGSLFITKNYHAAPICQAKSSD
jgi:hypothetical protein